jgi:hypothetical protein
MHPVFMIAAGPAVVDPISLAVSALGGALIAVAGGLIGAWLQGRREHKLWLRQRRFDLYNEFLAAAAVAHFDKLIGREDEFKLGLINTTSSVANLLLVGPTKVHDLASNVCGSLVTFDADGKQSLDYYATRGLFVLAAREVVGIDLDRDEQRRRAVERRDPTLPRGSGDTFTRPDSATRQES